jgi:hypothetical protein
MDPLDKLFSWRPWPSPAGVRIMARHNRHLQVGALPHEVFASRAASGAQLQWTPIDLETFRSI